MTTVKGATTVTYVRDATDRIVERKLNGTTTARYGSTGSGDAPEFTANASNAVQEVTYALPGGAMLTTRAAGNVWSYPNAHGDIAATANQTGAKQGSTTQYDPYGNLITGALPDNSAANLDYSWLGQHQRPLEHETTLQPTIEMGARQYSPLLGRFIEVDPIEGGTTTNDYGYVPDPVNMFDLSGEATCRDWEKLKIRNLKLKNKAKNCRAFKSKWARIRTQTKWGLGAAGGPFSESSVLYGESRWIDISFRAGGRDYNMSIEQTRFRMQTCLVIGFGSLRLDVESNKCTQYWAPVLQTSCTV